MIVNELTLLNFRNYSNHTVRFSEGINIIVDDNGMGKTNILEALTVISDTKSFRTNNDDILIRHGQDHYRIDLKTERFDFHVIYADKKKHYLINKTPVRNSDFIGKCNAVLFEPSELNIYKDSPKKRRKLMDMEISKVSRDYLFDSINYYNLIKEKNNLLKNNDTDVLLIETINEKLAQLIYKITIKRKEFIDSLNGDINKYFQYLSGTKSTVSITYGSIFIDKPVEEISDILKDSFTRDRFYRSSVIGSHKEDMIFYLDDKPVRDVASQGQKRLITIAYKLSLINYIIRAVRDVPILLLDDILSELDNQNQNRLLKVLEKNKIQTVITTTDISNINIDREYQIITIKGGENNG